MVKLGFRVYKMYINGNYAQYIDHKNFNKQKTYLYPKKNTTALEVCPDPYHQL